MNENKKLDICYSLISKNNILVLATQGNDGVHTSLMAYASSSDCREIYMVSSRNSRKCENISLFPQVSLLIDDRDHKIRDRRHEIKALTIKGIYLPVQDKAEEKNILNHISESVPQIAAAFSGPENMVIRIKAESFQLLDGPENSFSYYLESNVK